MISQNRLFVLDDEPEVARTIAMIAEKAGFAVQLFSEAPVFFQAVQAWAPTHIAVDLVMPGMDGLEVLNGLASLSCRSRIIIISGIGTRVLDAAKRAALERGLNITGILPKPFKPKILRELLALSGHESFVAGESGLRDNLEISESDIGQALAHGQFVLHYQPKICLRQGGVAGFEALIRWQHPRLGLVQPNHFIHLVERSGRMNEVTRHVIDVGLDWLHGMGGGDGIMLEFNVSLESLCDPSLAGFLACECDRRGIDRRRIILEITETSSLGNFREAIDLLTRLRINGFQLAMDDYGTGYSSMQQLLKFPFSELKIDQSFVTPMLQSGESRKIVESTVRLGRSLGLVTVAEGVENAATMDLLRDIGCDLAQGYHISRPMASAAVAGWLGSQPLSTGHR